MKNPPRITIASTPSRICRLLAQNPRLQALLYFDPRFHVRDFVLDALDDHFGSRGKDRVVDTASPKNALRVSDLERHLSINVRANGLRHTCRMTLEDIPLVVGFVFRRDLPPIPHE